MLHFYLYNLLKLRTYVRKCTCMPALINYGCKLLKRRLLAFTHLCIHYLTF